MQQNFIKRIQGHELEFNRNIYPVSYNVSIKDFNDDGIVLALQKDEKGIWTVSTVTKLPVWFNEITLDIHYAIERNESSCDESTLNDDDKDSAIKKAVPYFPVQLSCLY